MSHIRFTVPARSKEKLIPEERNRVHLLREDVMGFSTRSMALLAAVLGVLFGCGNQGLDLTVRFDRIEGLKTEDPVIFDRSPIGSVTRVTYRDSGDFLVDLVIESSHSNIATKHSRFFIADRPEVSGQKAVEIIKLKEGGVALAPGTQVEGTTRYGATLDRLSRDMGAAIGDLTDRFNRFLKDLEAFPESDQARQLEQELDRLFDSMKTLGESSREMFVRDMLPRIREEIERLRKSLERQGREDEMEAIDRKMRRIESELSV
ncbi:MAG: MlaD family protein [Desulfobacterales bacterium]|nr:MlaD family protein [Desulfobacterales bacterium]